MTNMQLLSNVEHYHGLTLIKRLAHAETRVALTIVNAFIRTHEMYCGRASLRLGRVIE